MIMKINRRVFVSKSVLGITGLGLSAGKLMSNPSARETGRIGIIGLDTSHSTAFTRAINTPDTKPEFAGFRIVAAYPRGSKDIESSTSRIAGYTEEVKKYGVEITSSIEELISKVDYILLETNDGRPHLEQAIPVLKSGKRMFIDKPMAASLEHVIAIFKASDHYKVPVFTSSSLRYITGIQDVENGKIGKVIGADTFSPCTLEKTHPDLFWYGIHGVEILFTVMGTGCRTVIRVSTPGTDVAVGTWDDDRIGSFRGIRSGKGDYGGNVFGEKSILALGPYRGYDPLLIKILEFFRTGIEPVRREETLEIFAFMQAAEISKEKGGVPVEIEKVMADATRKAQRISYD